MPNFNHRELKLVEPSFDSPLMDLILELDHLRQKRLQGSTHLNVFFELTAIFHIFESIGSARIEGNNTTISEYIEIKLQPPKTTPPNIKEIQNIENGMSFIEENIQNHPIDKLFLSEIHKKIVEELSPPPAGEGDATLEEYRKQKVNISGSSHQPPDPSQVTDYKD